MRSGGTISIKTTSTGTAAAPPKPKKKKVKKVTKKKKAVEGGFLNKGTTAAKHTHDKGYDKWAKFDVVSHLYWEAIHALTHKPPVPSGRSTQ